ncbi:hypothetical protein [Streptomyces sp. enrichment culture]|uniref:hypothetical protein n=1 Tax=Streptomyces sp. enrichment culture TaxID=1795815 RepID=UPI003F575107
MAIDPTDPETFVEDETTPEDEELDVEAPRADVADQLAEIHTDEDDPLAEVDRSRANEADLVEQARVVALDEDDYR